jgi:hypothetical protein
MNEVEIQIRYSRLRSPAELTVSTPAGFETAARMWGVLRNARVTPTSSRLLRVGQQLVIATRLTEDDGTHLSQRRTGEVLEMLRAALTMAGEQAVSTTVQPVARTGVAFAKPGPADQYDADVGEACA